MHILQSRVGKVLSNWDMCPPMEGFLSTKYTLTPIPARSSAARMPAIPAPMITTGFAAASAISAFTPRVDEPFVCKASKNVYCRVVCYLQPDCIRSLC